MKKIFSFCALALWFVIGMSCSSSENKNSASESSSSEGSEVSADDLEAGATRVDDQTLKVNVPSSKIYGETGEYLELVPGTYALMTKDNDLRMKVTLRLKKAMGEGEVIADYPYVNLLDSDETEVSGYNSHLSVDNRDKFADFLKSEEGTEASFLFKNVFASQDVIEKSLKETYQITVDHLSVMSQEALDEKERVSQEELDKSVEDCKKVIEVGKSAFDMLNELTE